MGLKKEIKNRLAFEAQRRLGGEPEVKVWKTEKGNWRATINGKTYKQVDRGNSDGSLDFASDEGYVFTVPTNLTRLHNVIIEELGRQANDGKPKVGVDYAYGVNVAELADAINAIGS